MVLGFSESAEFTAASAAALTAWMRALGGGDRLEGGSGDNTLFGGWLSDSFVFDAGEAGDHRVIGLEAWDTVELQNSGFTGGAAALAALDRSGSDVLLQAGAAAIRFADTQLADFSADMFVVA